MNVHDVRYGMLIIWMESIKLNNVIYGPIEIYFETSWSHENFVQHEIEAECSFALFDKISWKEMKSTYKEGAQDGHVS